MSPVSSRILVPAALGVLLFGGCKGDGEPQDSRPPEDTSSIPACDGNVDATLFSRLPVAEEAIGEVIVFGELDPGGGDVIPNGQSGIRLLQQGAELVSPADTFVVAVESSTWIKSPTREGETDYALVLRSCQEATVNFSHMVSLTADLEALLADAECQEYSTETETINDCGVAGLEIPVSAGQPLGTVGGPTAGGFDFDMMDERVVSVVTERATADQPYYKNAVCFSRYYSGGDREFLESRTGLLGDMRDGEPACGTIEVDVPGTGQGVWVRADNPVNYWGNSQYFLTLAPHGRHPDDMLELSFGGQELRPLLEVTRSMSGRTNRDFSLLPADDQIYCYAKPSDTISVFIALSPSAELTVERVMHDMGKTPCSDAPETWAFSEAAVTYIR